uniref:Uncharacterized protein n=1 Tax=Chromera velia CCMP2878 TaxID=1169474 RepID=A0A0G4HVM5_9ALVE|eukprot:Cvel_8860.t1-p1 / transcript=Cvel_8860.t1 / gene=Cvel_8860 / organism=Chromera_velia_CCMP2878 / gene_product=hypothetical protein / transcript_product=hypothetical protein / location=Cvel_scaffold498:24520-25535(+) / protein_length=224 / sequence_SO=supercontig / SO=protein_coding / is_pseudo=false
MGLGGGSRRGKQAWTFGGGVYIQMGADMSFLSSVSRKKDLIDRMFALGSLAAIERARGPILEQLISAVSLRGEEEGGWTAEVRIDSHICDFLDGKSPYRHPLVTALKEQWQGGVIALIEGGAGVTRSHRFRDGHWGETSSPVAYAIKSCQWRVAERLIRAGGRLGPGESDLSTLLDESVDSDKLSADAVRVLWANMGQPSDSLPLPPQALLTVRRSEVKACNQS